MGMSAGKVKPVAGQPVLGRDRYAPLLQLPLDVQPKAARA